MASVDKAELTRELVREPWNTIQQALADDGSDIDIPRVRCWYCDKATEPFWILVNADGDMVRAFCTSKHLAQWAGNMANDKLPAHSNPTARYGW